MYIERKIDSYLESWKADDDRKPLIVKGARQIGKTESIRRFARKYYKNVIEINFVDEPVYKQIIVDGYKAAETAKVNQLRPYYYFKYILTELPKLCDEKGNIDPAKLDYLMPWTDSLPDECRKPRRP